MSCVILFLCFSPFSIAITKLGEERANLSAFRTFVRFALVWFCQFPLPLGVLERHRLVIVSLPGLVSYLICVLVILYLLFSLYILCVLIVFWFRYISSQYILDIFWQSCDSSFPAFQILEVIIKNLGQVVQSIVSLTSSLRVISLTVLADSIYNILIFFAEKM